MRKLFAHSFPLFPTQKWVFKKRERGNKKREEKELKKFIPKRRAGQTSFYKAAFMAPKTRELGRKLGDDPFIC